MVLRNTHLIFVLIILTGYFPPAIVALSSVNVSSASPDFQLTSYAVFKSSPVQLFSSKNVSIASASLLSCVVRGATDDTCFAVNFSDQDGICQLMYSDGVTAIHDQPTGGNSKRWKSIEIREVQNVDTTLSPIVEEGAFPTTSVKPHGCALDMAGEFGDSCYKLVRDEISMFAAVTWCETDGGHLVDVDSQKEQDVLCGFVEEALEIWTGGTFDEGVAYWISSGQDVGYTNWLDSATPTQTTGTAVYLDTSKPGCPWRIQSFTAPRTFICEYKK